MPTNSPTQTDPRDPLGRVDHGFSLAETRIDLTDALHALPQRDRALLAEYFVQERSQAAIAAARGVSQMQISRMIAAAVARLRSRMQVSRGLG